MKDSYILKTALWMALAMTAGACAKKRTTYAPTNGGPGTPPPPSVNWNNPNTVNNLNGQSNLCYVSNTNYFAGQNYQTVQEPIYAVYYDYCAGYYRYYFQGYYYYFTPSGNCQWGPPRM